MIEIKEGHELDKAVAEAIGLKCIAMVPGGEQWFVDPREGTSSEPRVFCPSTDWNDMFEAAEISFSEYTVHKRGDGKYEMECYFKGDDGRSRCGEYSSPCLAICAAILMKISAKQKK